MVAGHHRQCCELSALRPGNHSDLNNGYHTLKYEIRVKYLAQNGANPDRVGSMTAKMYGVRLGLLFLVYFLQFFEGRLGSNCER